MRYIIDSGGLIKHISFGADISCNGETCTEYTGTAPFEHGYSSLEEWYMDVLQADELHLWTISGGQLSHTLDGTAPEPDGWDCPPMEIGVEYKTKKMHNGAPIYTKMLEVYELPNSETSSISINPVTGYADIISVTGILSDTAAFTLGYNKDDKEAICFWVTANDGFVRISSENDMSTLTALITVEYFY